MASKSPFLDGCHKYGWIINIIVTFFMIGIAWGELRQDVADIHNSESELVSRVTRIENILICGSALCK